VDVWSLTVAALRRWYVFLPALLVTAVLTMSAGSSIAPEYETTGAALLVPPGVASEKVNPYAASSGPEVLRTIVNGSAVRGRFAAQGLEPGYEITVTTRTPIYQIRVRSGDRQRTVGTASAVIEALRQELAKGQREFGIPPEAMVTVQIIDAPDSVVEVGTGTLPIKALVALLGLSASVALAVTYDDIRNLIRRRRSDRAADKRLRVPSPRNRRRPEHLAKLKASA
jgi:hypothetical protein